MFKQKEIIKKRNFFIFPYKKNLNFLFYIT